MNTWTKDEVSAWLEKKGLRKDVVTLLNKNGLDGQGLRNLSDQALMELGVSGIADRRIIFMMIADYKMKRDADQAQGDVPKATTSSWPVNVDQSHLKQVNDIQAKQKAVVQYEMELKAKEARLNMAMQEFQDEKQRLQEANDLLISKNRGLEKALASKTGVQGKFTISSNVIVVEDNRKRKETIQNIVKPALSHKDPSDSDDYDKSVNDFLDQLDHLNLDDQEMGNSQLLASVATTKLLERRPSLPVLKTGQQIAFGIIQTAEYIIELLNVEWRTHGDPSFRSLHQNNGQFMQLIKTLLPAASAVLEADPLCLKLQSPCYVMGDIHGNYGDLSFFMEQLLTFGDIQYTAHKFLFLGDYVDRGAGSVEVCLYLLALKILAPSKVFLLRGNHEVWTINGDRETYGGASFQAICCDHFGRKEGAKIWEAFNEVFSVLPLCGIVDEKVFCVHGGIPKYAGGRDERLSSLADPQFPRYYTIDFFSNDPPEVTMYKNIAMGYLWNDPAADESELDQFGFGPNPRGVHTQRFGLKAIKTFLENHGLEYIIRAHEVKQNGLRVCKMAQLITVFTSSQYCGGNNSSATVFIDEGKIRFVTKQTSGDPHHR